MKKQRLAFWLAIGVSTIHNHSQLRHSAGLAPDFPNPLLITFAQLSYRIGDRPIILTEGIWPISAVKPENRPLAAGGFRA